MKTKQLKDFEMGRHLWNEYVRVNGYAFRPNDGGLKKLAKLLDLNIPYIRSMINLFLET